MLCAEVPIPRPTAAKIVFHPSKNIAHKLSTSWCNNSKIYTKLY